MSSIVGILLSGKLLLLHPHINPFGAIIGWGLLAASLVSLVTHIIRLSEGN
jgi:hypothetical protein